MVSPAVRNFRQPVGLEQFRRDLADPNTSPQVRAYIERRIQILNRQANSTRPTPVDSPGTTRRHTIGGDASPIGGLRPVIGDFFGGPVEGPFGPTPTRPGPTSPSPVGGIGGPVEGPFLPPPGGGGPPSPGNAFNQDLISEIFGQRPGLALQGNIANSGLRPNQQKFLRGRASDFLGRFEQAIGQQLVGGNLPTLLPEDFFKNLNFQNELGRFSPATRGEGRARLAPQTRFLRR